MRREIGLTTRCILVTLLLATFVAQPSGVPAVELPGRLGDGEWWRLSTELSEPDGNFRSENLISNEMVLARLLPEVTARVTPNGAYLGVGPEQNFSYLAAIRPQMAFIIDVRRGNLHVLLMYKALFELSADRAEFVSRLFTKPRPSGLSTMSTARQLMDAYDIAPTGTEAAFNANLTAIVRHLTTTRAIPLSPNDQDGVARAYRAFYFYGPSIDYSASTALTRFGGGRQSATYRDLMTQADEKGQELSYLSSEEKFRYLKDLHSRNLLVPVVGNFSGPKSIRAVGEYVRRHGSVVTAFYVSTVEPYLRREGALPVFCESVASLPVNDRSVFIRPGNLQQLLQIAAPAARAAVTSPAVAGVGGLGNYQGGIVAPIQGGCG
jgi:hypothetical protein